MEVGTKTPEEWLRFITNERKTYSGPNKYKYWMQLYRRAADSIPADEFAHNNNAYAKIMVDFAKLQARTSEDDARTIFQAARSNVKHCSLIYVAWAQFELLNGNPKKCKKLLAKGKQFCAEPGYLLDKALKNFESGNDQLIDDETEEYTFTELINKNVSKTEDYTDHHVKPRQRTSDSSIDSTSSLSPESVNFTESSEESDECIYLKGTKPSRSNNLACIEEFPSVDMRKKVIAFSTNTAEGRTTGQPAEADVQSSFFNRAFKENQTIVPTHTIATVSTERNAYDENNHLTMKPPSNDMAAKQFTSQNSTKEAVAPDLKRSTSGLSSLSCLKDKSRVSADGEGSDDIDALSLKKTLLNFGTTTGLRNFATPQNKSSDQAVAAKADTNIGGSLVKGRKSNRRAKRSVFIGLPQRVPKLTNDDSKDKQGEQDESDKNIQVKNESVLKTKENDCVDGVFAFPQDDQPSEAQAQDSLVSEIYCLGVRKSKDLDGISESKPRISPKKISPKLPPSNTQHTGNDKENVFPANFNSDISSVGGKMSHGNIYSRNSSVYLHNNPNLSSTKMSSTADESAGTQSTKSACRLDHKTQSDIRSIAPLDRRIRKPPTESGSNFCEHGSELRQRTPLASIGLDIVNKPLHLAPSQLENPVQKCRANTGEKPNQHLGETFQSGHCGQKSTLDSKTGSRHDSLKQKNSFTLNEGSAEVKTPHTSCSNDSKSRSLSFTLPSNTTSKSVSCASAGLSKLGNSMSEFQHGMQEISRMTAQSSSAIQGVTVNGKMYNKLNMIGRGGSSEVYAVFDSDYAQYALKYVDIKGADASVVESYVNEITLLKRLQEHESIIKLHDWEMDEVNKVIKIVLERGSTDLAGYLKKNPDEITVDFIKMCWRKMLDAVDVIHKEGIIHSDLKPANFLLVEWNLKLIDFGIANAIQSDVTSFYRDSTIGTLSYMSPEALKDVSQSHGQGGQHKPMMKIGRPSDVWSLGCILYVMVYGKTPFQHIRNNFQKWSCIIDPNYEIKFPHIKNQDLLDSMKGCLRRNPSERYTIAQLKSHPFLTGRISDNDVDNVLNCLMQMQDINSPRTLRTFAQNLVGHLSSGSSLSIASAQPCQNSKGK